jgi:phasin family protein
MTQDAARASNGVSPGLVANGARSAVPRQHNRPGAAGAGRSAATGRPARASGGPADQDLPFPALPGGQLAFGLWQASLAMSLRVGETWCQGAGALLQEQLAWLQQAGEEAFRTSQAMLAEPDPIARLRLGAEQAREAGERALANAATLLDLLSRPAQETLELLARQAEEAGAGSRRPADRAA